MANLNKVLLLGNLTRDPELRYTPKGTAVADIAVAINRVWNNEQNQRQEETTFVDITLWGRQAEIAQQYLSKGRGVFIEGRLQMDTWEDKASGQKRSKLKVVAENLQFMPDGKGNGGGGISGNQGSPSTSSSRGSSHGSVGGSAADDSGFQEEDDIPF
ncbi:MAG: single-stranded DNA-binding protein [Verrucomicrobiota bacterium]|jgi:single-strand DNA-binding protein